MNKNQLAYIALAVFLIVFGLIGFLSNLAPFSILIPILAIASGLFLILFTPGYSLRAGWIASGIYLVATGLRDLIGFTFMGMNILLAILGIAAGSLTALPSLKSQQTCWCVIVLRLVAPGGGYRLDRLLWFGYDHCRLCTCGRGYADQGTQLEII